jgi:glycosyltransferase involved in cell wall biosynthesis
MLVIAPYPLHTAPGQRFRFEQYLLACASADIEVTVSPLLSTRDMEFFHRSGHVPAKLRALFLGAAKRTRDLARARHFDLIYIYREAFFVGPGIVETMLHTMHVPYIFDFDDAIYLPTTSTGNAQFAWFKDPGKVAGIVRGASIVLAGNQHLANWAKQHNSAVEVFPTTINTEVYRVRKEDPTRPLCVGWTGSPTTVSYLHFLDKTLINLQDRHKIKLRVIGAPDYKLNGAEVELTPWKESTEPADLAAVDIGLMPLPDDEWSRGKCGGKALQYMGLGIPAVLSPVGVNVEIAHDNAALLASSEQEWMQALELLITNESQRREYGQRGRKRVEEQFSVSAHAERFIELLHIASSDG